MLILPQSFRNYILWQRQGKQPYPQFRMGTSACILYGKVQQQCGWHAFINALLKSWKRTIHHSDYMDYTQLHLSHKTKENAAVLTSTTKWFKMWEHFFDLQRTNQLYVGSKVVNAVSTRLLWLLLGCKMCSLVAHYLYSAEPFFNSRSDVRLWGTVPLNQPIVRPSDGRWKNMEY